MTGIQDHSKQKKHAGGINPWRALSKKRRLPTLPHCPIWHGVPSVHGQYGDSDFQDLSKRKRPERFLSKVFVKKKGGYLLSRIALFDTVYHQCMDGMVAAISHIAQNEQMKKRSLDCSNERFDWKKAATYSPALPYLTRCTIGAWTVRWRRFPILHKMNN